MEPLHRALTEAQAVVADTSTDRAQRLVLTGMLVVVLRTAIRADDWAAVAAHLANAVAQSRAPVLEQGVEGGSQKEVKTIRTESESRQAQLGLVSALRRGDVRGSPGVIDVGSIDVEPLTAALKVSAAVGAPSDSLQSLATSGLLVQNLRRAIKRADGAMLCRVASFRF